MSIEAMKQWLEALITAEAGLADIGDADREPGDDLAWCEARAAQALPAPRSAITSLRQALSEAQLSVNENSHAIEQASSVSSIQSDKTSDAEKQDAWKPNDTAYRPGGLPQDFIVHEVENEGDWSEWVCPDPEQYFMKCCDCGLVHEMQFKVVKYSEGDECDGVDDHDVRGIFRARRRSNA
jgi:hypothetical protein